MFDRQGVLLPSEFQTEHADFAPFGGILRHGRSPG